MDGSLKIRYLESSEYLAVKALCELAETKQLESCPPKQATKRIAAYGLLELSLCRNLKRRIYK